ncbi:DoxX family membrane protein [Qaidamihabitans albus]|uniref:DoxX family membrane protein n=1 Tax=Qaidamihabitans albus TaxID=2795733 RepID=UPI0018F10CA8|nr:DoxX family membrane protein [Qaidamihabitans albus]
MSVLVLIGRILFVAIFLASALGHLTQTRAMAGYAESKGVPFAKVLVPGTGVLLGVGGLMVLLGVWADLGALLLLVFLVPTALMMHPFWKEQDQQARQNEMIQFNKDISLGGAALTLFAFFAYVEDLGLTITGPLFGLG